MKADDRSVDLRCVACHGSRQWSWAHRMRRPCPEGMVNAPCSTRSHSCRPAFSVVKFERERGVCGM